MKFDQITIIGVGLIGGSIGLAVKKHNLAVRIVGVTAHEKSFKDAERIKAIDSGTLNARKSVSGSDLVILATPVDKVLSTLEEVAPHLEKDCIVIDVASVKKEIVKDAEKIVGRKNRFIGTHPIAGSEQRGVSNADAGLFKNAPCIITKTKNTDERALNEISDFWKKLGARVYVMSPEKHDKEISRISHLPHTVASATASSISISDMEFIGTGFKDTTRIASGDPDLWTSILMANRANVSADISSNIKIMERIRRALKHAKRGELKKILSDAKKKRDRLSTNGK